MSDAIAAVSISATNRGATQLTLSRLGIAFVVVALALFAARQALRLPGGQGIEDLLGWERIDSVRTAVMN